MLGILLIIPVALAVPLSALIGSMVGIATGFYEGMMLCRKLFERGLNHRPFETQYEFGWSVPRKMFHDWRVGFDKISAEQLPPDFVPFEMSPRRALLSLCCGAVGGSMCSLGFFGAAVMYAVPTVAGLFWRSCEIFKQDPRLFLFWLAFVLLLIPVYTLFVVLNPLAGLLCGAWCSVGSCYTVSSEIAVARRRQQFCEEQEARQRLNLHQRELLSDDIDRGVAVDLTATLPWRPECADSKMQLALPPSLQHIQPDLFSQILSHLPVKSLCMVDQVAGNQRDHPLSTV